MCFNAVCANDLNQTASLQLGNDENSQVLSLEQGVNELAVSSDDSQNIFSKSAKKISTTAKTPSETVFKVNSKYTIQILDNNGKGIPYKLVKVTYNNKTSNLTTNSKGQVSIKLDVKGDNRVTFSFKDDKYAAIYVSKAILVVGSDVSKLKGYNYVAYVGATNNYIVTLTTGGYALSNQNVIFKINGKSYTKKTNSKGQAKLPINLAKGTYKVKYTFKGIKNAKAASGSSKITVKKGMPTKIVLQKLITYKEKTPDIFRVKYRDTRGNPIVGKTLVFTVNKKTYKVKTDRLGAASITINLKAGKYTLKVSSCKDNVYLKSANSYTIYVRSLSKFNGGFWLFGSDMKKVDLDTMAKNGINHIFLNFKAVELYGKNQVANFATSAKSLGIKVHIWMQAFYSGGRWITPVYSDGSFKYDLFDSIIKQAKEYAKIDGVAGIHFDYLRFGGTASSHKNGVEAINYFVKQACDELHALNPSIIVSGAIMPEPSSLKTYYGQDIPTISKYLDVLVPMVYKGNYNQDASWVKSVTSTLVSQSNGAEVWTGLQGYASDTDVQLLSTSTLKTDAKYAVSGGATGVIVFRYTLFNLIDFNCLIK